MIRLRNDLVCVMTAALGLLVTPLVNGEGGSRGVRGSMIRDEAQRIVSVFMREAGLVDTGLNDKGLAGGILEGARMYFEYDEQTRTLHSRAHIFSFRPKPMTAAEREEIWRAGADTTTLAGSRLEYMPENNGLFLTRSYPHVADTGAFAADMKRLAEASLVWREKILPKALESANQKKAPASR